MDSKILEEIEESLNARLIISFRNSTVCNSNEEELIIDKFETIHEFCNCYGAFMGNGKCKESNYFYKTINTINSTDYIMIISQ